MAKEILRTPAGKSFWAKLVTPDTKFDANGVYSVKVRFDADACEDLRAVLDKKVEESYEAALEEKPKLKATLSTQPAYTEVFDDNGNSTGEFEFNFKLKAKGKTKDGREFEQRPVILDAKGASILKFDGAGKVLNDGFSIGNGSIIKVAFEAVPYFAAATKKAGVSLRLRAVQVIELKTFGGGNNFGFDVEDGGFEYKDEFAAAAPAPAATNNNKNGEDTFEDSDEDADF